MDPKNLQVLLYQQKTKGKIGNVSLTNLEGIETETDININKNDLKKIIIQISDKCNGEIDKSHLYDNFHKNQIYMILYHQQKPIGFILARKKYRDDLGNSTSEAYIDLICSEVGSGSFLMNYFIQYAKKNKFKAISLSSLPNVLTYYPKFGFSNRHTCDKKEKGSVFFNFITYTENIRSHP